MCSYTHAQPPARRGCVTPSGLSYSGSSSMSQYRGGYPSRHTSRPGAGAGASPKLASAAGTRAAAARAAAARAAAKAWGSLGRRLRGPWGCPAA